TAIASKLYTDPTTFTVNANITGSWLLAQPVNGFEYGLSAVGGGGLFSSNQFTSGGGGDDFGTAGSGTDLNLNTFKNKFPLVDNTVTFTLTGLGNAATGIDSVEFGYNSSLSETLTG